MGHDSTADGHSLHAERWALRDVSSVRVGRRVRPSGVAGAVWAAVYVEGKGGGTDECRQPTAGAAALRPRPAGAAPGRGR